MFRIDSISEAAAQGSVKAVYDELRDSMGMELTANFFGIILHHRSACLKVKDQLNFLNGGGAMVEYDSKKIRSELHSLFAGRLEGISKRMNC